MQWTDHAIVLRVDPFGEHSFIVTVFSREHGLYKGLSRHKKVTVGDFVQARWVARLPEQLGMWQFEGIRSYSALVLHSRFKLQCLLVFCELLRAVMPERAENKEVFEEAITFLESFLEGSREILKKYLLFECFLLSRIGFALDFSDFVLSSEEDPLYFVSPRTGRVVTRSVGYPYRSRLLLFPQFLLGPVEAFLKISDKDLREGFVLTDHFLSKLLEKSDSLKKMRYKMITEKIKACA